MLDLEECRVRHGDKSESTVGHHGRRRMIFETPSAFDDREWRVLLLAISVDQSLSDRELMMWLTILGCTIEARPSAGATLEMGA